MKVEIVIGDPRGEEIPTDEPMSEFEGTDARAAAKAYGQIGQTLTRKEDAERWLGRFDVGEESFDHATFARQTVVHVHVDELETMTVYTLPMVNRDASGEVKPGGEARTPDTSTQYLAVVNG